MTVNKITEPDKTSKTAPQDAIALLKADHQAVSQMFDEYEKTRSLPKKKALVAEICPAVKTALKDKLMVPEAMVEHTGVKVLLAQAG